MTLGIRWSREIIPWCVFDSQKPAGEFSAQSVVTHRKPYRNLPATRYGEIRGILWL